MSANRFMAVAQDVANGAREFNRNVALVWTKADIDLDSLVFDEGLSVQEAKRQLRMRVESDRQRNGLGHLPFFMVSARNWARRLNGDADAEVFDMEALLTYVRGAVEARVRP
ncbi:hypothetical protein DFJ74DRAFT_705110 [Hyaloraphidium curvatum]|nr:hypothetical protein DFJ74DRAFT_705110 [Hyaloraphidium curvatum]